MSAWPSPPRRSRSTKTVSGVAAAVLFLGGSGRDGGDGGAFSVGLWVGRWRRRCCFRGWVGGKVAAVLFLRGSARNGGGGGVFWGGGRGSVAAPVSSLGGGGGTVAPAILFVGGVVGCEAGCGSVFVGRGKGRTLAAAVLSLRWHGGWVAATVHFFGGSWRHGTPAVFS